MTYHPLKNISEADQKQYYPNILKIGKDQKELENLLTQYKNTYQEFVNAANSINNFNGLLKGTSCPAILLVQTTYQIPLPPISIKTSALRNV